MSNDNIKDLPADKDGELKKDDLENVVGGMRPRGGGPSDGPIPTGETANGYEE